MTNGITRVLFVCHANVVRSPLAEGVFRNLVAQHGLTDRFMIDSAGISAYEGMAPDPGSIAVAAAHGIKLAGRSRQMTRVDLYDHDHVLVADRHVLAQIRRLTGALASGGARVRLLATLADPHAEGEGLAVHDPLREGPEGYLQVYRQIHRACVALLAELA
jgi:protein-tyrosine phosphatase